VIPLEDAVVEEDADSITGFRFTFGLFTVIGKDYFFRFAKKTVLFSISLNHINHDEFAETNLNIYNFKEGQMKMISSVGLWQLINPFCITNTTLFSTPKTRNKNENNGFQT
jgi:hypothetical protein